MAVSSAFKKLPPHVRRELLRHVSTPQSAKAPLRDAAQAAEASRENLVNQKKINMNRTLTASLTLLGVASSFPLMAWFWIGNLYDREEPLTGPQNRRGAFNNSGSNDVGADPDWDFKAGRHKYEKGFGEISEQSDGSPMGRGSTPVDPNQLKKYDSNALLAAARGLPPQASYKRTEDS